MVNNQYRRYEEEAEFLKVLAHPVRLSIVKSFIENGSCNVTNMHSYLGMPQSTISQHLQKLRSIGVIKGERNGLEIIYEVIDKRVERIIDVLDK